MKLIALTRAGYLSQRKFFINPEHVVAILERDNGTYLRLATNDEKGKPIMLGVSEPVDEVYRLLTGEPV